MTTLVFFSFLFSFSLAFAYDVSCLDTAAAAAAMVTSPRAYNPRGTRVWFALPTTGK